jgi:glycosyltransferase involved in cell wall biosynthesis
LSVAAVGDPELEYPPEVVAQFVPEAGLRMPRAVASRFDLIVIQHEFGIFGDDDGIAVLDLAASSSAPVITVLHTVLAKPFSRQRHIIEHLAEHSAGLVVMSEAARQRLQDHYRVDGCPVDMIPHGAEISPTRTGTPRPMILSWGLLGPGKGIESGIRAMRHLRHLEPTPTYVIAGQTHPNVLKSQGEAYRVGLKELAEEEGVADMVRFINRYLTAEDLNRLRSEAAAALLPYENREQVTSGALVETLGAGVPVVATRFPHAVELLEAGAGELVDQGDHQAMAESLERLLVDPARRLDAISAIDELKPRLSWEGVASAYNRLFAIVADEAGAA